jgi:hypothetical protein
MAGAIVRLSSSAPSFLEASKTADYDVIRHVEIRDGVVDANNVFNYGHVIFGTTQHSTSALTTLSRVGIDDVQIRNVRAINIPTDWTETNHSLRSGVYLMAALTGAAGETDISVTNIICEDVRVEGGEFGIAVGARFTTSGRIYVDNIHYSRCWHDTGTTPPNYHACTNFFIGARGYGGFASISGCRGFNSGDDGVEINGMEYAIVSDTIIEDCCTAGFLHNQFSPPKRRGSQKISFRNCHHRVVALSSGSASMQSTSFRLNTSLVTSTTTAAVAIGATAVPLASIGAGDIFFPTRGDAEVLVNTTTTSTVTLPVATIPVADTTGMPTSGTAVVNGQIVDYTGITANSLTGCNTGKSGSGSVVSGSAVQVRQGQVFSYTGIAGSSLTGVTGLATAVPSGSTIRACNDVHSAEITGCSTYKRNQPYWEYNGDAVKVNGPIRHLTIRDYNYNLDNTQAAIGAAAQPTPFYINALPTEGRDTLVRMDNIRMRLTGARTGGSTADWTGVALNGTELNAYLSNIEIDLAMTGMSVADSIAGVDIGHISNGVYTVEITGLRIRSLGDVGSVQKGVRTRTQQAINPKYIKVDGFDFQGMLTGSVDFYSDSGSFVQTRTYVQRGTGHGSGRRPNITPGTVTTGTWLYQNILMYEVNMVASGGTVSQIQIGPTSGTLLATGQTSGVFRLGPGDFIQVTSTVAPTVTAMPSQ